MKKIMGAILCIILLTTTGCGEKKNCEEKQESQVMYLSAGATIKLEFDEITNECDGTKTKVTEFVLKNNDAKTIFNNIDFKNKTLEEALVLIEDVAKNNEYKIEEMKIYTTSNNDYSSYLTYKVNNEVKSLDELENLFNKTIPLNHKYSLKIISGMEYYFEYYEFISDTKVHYTTKYNYGEENEDKTLNYSYEYYPEYDKILIKIPDLFNGAVLTYSFATNDIEWGNRL